MWSALYFFSILLFVIHFLHPPVFICVSAYARHYAGGLWRLGTKGFNALLPFFWDLRYSSKPTKCGSSEERPLGCHLSFTSFFLRTQPITQLRWVAHLSNGAVATGTTDAPSNCRAVSFSTGCAGLLRLSSSPTVRIRNPQHGHFTAGCQLPSGLQIALTLAGVVDGVAHGLSLCWARVGSTAWAGLLGLSCHTSRLMSTSHSQPSQVGPFIVHLAYILLITLIPRSKLCEYSQPLINH